MFRGLSRTGFVRILLSPYIFFLLLSHFAFSIRLLSFARVIPGTHKHTHTHTSFFDPRATATLVSFDLSLGNHDGDLLFILGKKVDQMNDWGMTRMGLVSGGRAFFLGGRCHDRNGRLERQKDLTVCVSIAYLAIVVDLECKH